ncbi:hypothetical protein BDF21DRAFT_404050 [Thamnidium elegans]|nr:hypothetical protein BDF21DRAFT_404050 [Thamnidium elegans]
MKAPKSSKLTNNQTKVIKGVKTYCEKLDTYYKNNSIKIHIFEEYENQERVIRKKKTREIFRNENIISCRGLITDNTSIDRSSNASSSERIYEYLENDVDDTESIIITGDNDGDSRDEALGNNDPREKKTRTLPLCL